MRSRCLALGGLLLVAAVDLLPELQRRRPGINHWALHDRILSAGSLCRIDPLG